MTVRVLQPLTVLCLATALYGQSNYPYVMRTIAGSYPSSDGGPAAAALLESPSGVARDSKGNLYIADGDLHGIRKVTPDGIISTIAGITAYDVAVDVSGNVYAVDGSVGVYKITPSGGVSVIAGTTYGYSGDGGPAAAAKLAAPEGIALDAQGNIYIADTDNCRIRMVTPDGKIQTIAGTGVPGTLGNAAATQARLAYPVSVAVDSTGNVYIGEEFDIRKVDTSGIISTVAGLGTAVVDGPAVQSAIGSTPGLAVDSAGNLYVADSDNNRVRVITGTNIKTIAGTGTAGFSGDGGAGTKAQLDFPDGIALDSAGNLYVADQDNDRIREITAQGNINTIAGATHFAGDGGRAVSALLHLPMHAAGDSKGNLYFSDSANNRIRKIDALGNITTVAGTGICAYTGDNGAAIQAAVCGPTQLAIDASGNVYFADSENLVVRKISTGGVISTVAGTGTYGDTGDHGQATAATFSYPYGIALDSTGILYVSDALANRVRQISPQGVITPFAGTEQFGYSGDGSLATAAKLYYPGELAVDSSGNVYISDISNHRVRKVSNGIITSVVGITTCCASGSGANAAYIGTPSGVAVDGSGNVYVSESNFAVIAKVNQSANTIATIAGTGNAGFSGDGALATNASMNTPMGLWVTSAGDLYFADYDNSRIRELVLDTPSGLTIGAGDGQSGAAGSTLTTPLTVQMAFRGGVGVTGVPVTFAVTSGTATLSAATATTDVNGTAGVGVTLGSTAGPVVVTATAAGLTPVVFHLTATVAVPLPTISAGGITGGGGSIPSVTALSTGGFASIYGSNFAPAGTSRTVQASDMVNGSLPTNLAGVCVTVGGAPAFITYVSPGQINFQVPVLPSSGNVSVQVTTGCGTALALQSAAQTAPTAAAAPEFLFWTKTATGQNPVIAVDAATGAYVGAAGLIPGLTFAPAKPGEVLTIYMVSLGPTNPAVAPGAAPSAIASTVTPPVVRLGTAPLTSDQVLYAGVSPGTAGLYQLNIVVPPGLADGDYPISLALGSISTPTGAYLSVRQ